MLFGVWAVVLGCEVLGVTIAYLRRCMRLLLDLVGKEEDTLADDTC